MARRKKDTDFVGGFATLRAAQRHGLEKRYASGQGEDEPKDGKATDKGASASAAPRKTAGGIGRTTMPTQYQIVCYACGFGFTIRGRAEATQCPKCGARLGLKDETITGAFDQEITTAGKVTLAKSALMNGGTIIANDIKVEGIVKGGSLKAYKSLELAAGAVMPEDMIDAQHLIIGAGASFDFVTPRSFTDIQILGELKADLTATGQVHIGATGHFLGKLTAAHLTVDEGAGLNADLAIQPPPSEDTEAGDAASDAHSEEAA